MSDLRPPLISARLELRTFAAGDLDGLFAAVAHPRNRASRHVIEKLGMTFVGRRFCYGAELVEYELSAAGRRASSPAALESGSPAAPL